jgi:hypothetical protein
MPGWHVLLGLDWNEVVRWSTRIIESYELSATSKMDRYSEWGPPGTATEPDAL